MSRVGSKRLWIASVVISSVLVVASLASAIALGWDPLRGPAPSPMGGPVVEASAVVTGPGPVVPIAGAMISVFSEVPFALAASLAAKDLTVSDGQNVALYNGTTGTSGALTGRLSSLFGPIAQEWTEVASPMTLNVSLLVVGMYVVQNSTGVYEYNSFNYLPFAPSHPPASFQFSMGFNLARPATVLPPNSIAPSSSITPARTPCPNPSWEWVTDFDHTYPGPFPLVAANNTQVTAPDDATELSVLDSWDESSITLDFSGAEGNSNGSVSMSDTASWSGNGAAVNGTSASVAALSYSSRSFAMIYINDTELNILRKTWEQVTWNYNGQTCEPVYSHQTYYIWASVVGVSTSSFYFGVMAGSSAWGSEITSVFDGGTPSASLESGSVLHASSSQQFVQFLYQASGTSNIESLQSEVQAGASVLLSALGLTLAVMALASTCWIACTGGEAVAAASVVVAVAGFADSILAQLTTVSFQTNVQESIDTIAVSAVDGSFYLDYYKSLSSTELSTSEGSATDLLPLTYIVGTPT